MLAMDLVPETREGFLSRSERIQADGGRIIICVDWNCEEIVEWCSDRSSWEMV